VTVLVLGGSRCRNRAPAGRILTLGDWPLNPSAIPHWVFASAKADGDLKRPAAGNRSMIAAG